MCKRLDELNKSRSLHLNQIAIWTRICKYYAAKVNLNMNPACSALYEWSRSTVLFTNVTYTAVCRLNEDIHI